uniref:DUF202 domain-containing protein n=2 Tax=Ditylum brightwellii TaxID=49249 RepID=A0A7S4RA87_9STRA|mmetsp:Transcript_45530/g.68701  ORF Transcript_45530/g.68701 Transcript_45530/m.68701 type:complete len:250 (+) Transcript_45530:96-845(+)
MTTPTEKTPLMAAADDNLSVSTSPSRNNAYYFLDRRTSINSDTRSQDGGGGGLTESFRIGDVQSVIDTVPEGSTSGDFDSRPVMNRTGSTTGSKAQQQSIMKQQEQETFFQKIFGTKVALFHPTTTVVAPPTTTTRIVKAPIKVEPKVFFSNERTFLAWLHVSVILAGASVAISAFADANPWSQLYGVLLIPVAVAFICYAMYQYARRADMIRRKDPGPYEDLFGPTVLGIMLMLSIVAQFSIKLYEIM